MFSYLFLLYVYIFFIKCQEKILAYTRVIGNKKKDLAYYAKS